MAAVARICLLAVGLAVLVAVPAQAETFIVTKTADTNDSCDADDCSLREAITEANATADPDEVVLPAGVFRLDIDPTTFVTDNDEGDLDVNQPLTIRGAGPERTTIKMMDEDRVLQHHFGELVVRDLTITGGRRIQPGFVEGGGIASSTVLPVTLERVVVRGNLARSTGGAPPSAMGGGVAKAVGHLVVRDSALIDNEALGDTATGGAIGLYSGATSELENVTLTGNTARQGGAVLSLAQTTAVHVTAVGNVAELGGGAFAGDVTLRSSVVAGNPAGPPGDCEAGVSSEGGNVGSASCGFAAPADTVTADPGLAPLSWDVIPIFEPLAGGPALDRATGACPAADARGLARPQGAGCDAGSAERPAPVPQTPSAPPSSSDPPATPPAPAPQSPDTGPRSQTPPPSRARLATLPSRLTLDRRRRRASVRLRCLAGPTCRGRLALTVRRRVKGRLRTVTIGRASVVVRGGTSKTVRVTLTRTGRSLVRRSRSVRVRVAAELIGRTERRSATIRRG